MIIHVNEFLLYIQLRSTLSCPLCSCCGLFGVCSLCTEPPSGGQQAFTTPRSEAVLQFLILPFRQFHNPRAAHYAKLYIICTQVHVHVATQHVDGIICEMELWQERKGS